jgi:hypothetical protein
MRALRDIDHVGQVLDIAVNTNGNVMSPFFFVLRKGKAFAADPGLL